MEKEILSGFFEGFNQRNFVAMQNIYADNALIHGKTRQLIGGKGVVEIVNRWLEAIPDAQITPLHVSQEENNVLVIHWRVKGTFLNSIREMKPTGMPVIFHGLTSFRSDGQKIVEHWATVDYRPLQTATKES